MQRRSILLLVATAFAVSACGDGDGDGDAAPLDVPTSRALVVQATEMAFTPDEIAVRAGRVTVTLTNAGKVRHDIRLGKEPFVLEADPGKTTSSTVELEPGRYEMFCSLPGHREAGMEGVLEVRAE